MEPSMPPTVGQSMDEQTKREIWLLASGTFVVEAPIAALAAMVILAQ